jgi:hypothetical protein
VQSHAQNLVPSAGIRHLYAAARPAPRSALLGRHATRYPSLVGVARHPPGRRT